MTTEQGVDLTWGVRIPMRDGVHLNATLYAPKPQTEPLPAIFTMTPYIADSYHERAYTFAQRGYVFALVDCRGRGNSEGVFRAMQDDAQDGYDTVEWLAAQPWCNGKVGMWGGSYAGFNQWATASRFPPHLATLAPAAAACPGVDVPWVNGVLDTYEVRWLILVAGRTGNSNLFGEESFWIDKWRELYLNHLPYKDLDRIVGCPSPTFQEWVAHPSLDDYWASMAPTQEQFARIDLPILTITGHYDDDQPGALHFYRQHMALASAAARERHFLIIGPWDHAGTRTPQREFGGLTFGEASIIDLNQLHTEWYDWTMKDGPRPEFLQARVAYYVAGAEEWKYADRLESIATGTRRLYLDSHGGQANDAFHSGVLADEPPGESAPDRYVYDPLDTRPAEIERQPIKDTFTDQRYALNLFGNGLVYHSPPFAEDTEVSGTVTFVAWIALDVPDTDFIVTLYEILPDGRSVWLTHDLLRARYRESLREAKPVTPGEITRYVFDDFLWFSRRVGRGSRLRLVIACPNSIHWQKNYNSGGVVAEETAADARTAHVTLYHDAAHPSYLELPVV